MIFAALQYAAAIALLTGGVFSVLAALGIWRMPDLYTRLHAASKAGTLGCGLVFLGMTLAAFDFSIAARAVLGIVFVAMTTPVSAHLLARAAIKTGSEPISIALINEFPKQPRG